MSIKFKNKTNTTKIVKYKTKMRQTLNIQIMIFVG